MGHAIEVGPWVSVYYDLQPPNVWAKHSHTDVQIVISLGRVECTLSWGLGRNKRRAEVISEPFVWIVGGGVPHAAEWRGTGTMIVLYVDPRFVREDSRCTVRGGTVLRLEKLEQRDFLITRLCRKFDDVCRGRRHYSSKLISATAGVLAPTILNAWLHPCAGVRSARPGLTDAQLERVANYVDEHFREPIDRMMLAREAGLAVSHFSRMFKAATGLAPMQYVWRCRLYRARHLLETGGWKVAAVAVECGFCDQSHLIRQFRKEFNCLPGSVIPPGAER